MRYELTLEQLYEIAQCISINALNSDEACNYVRDVVEEMNDIELIDK